DDVGRCRWLRAEAAVRRSQARRLRPDHRQSARVPVADRRIARCRISSHGPLYERVEALLRRQEGWPPLAAISTAVCVPMATLEYISTTQSSRYRGTDPTNLVAVADPQISALGMCN